MHCPRCVDVVLDELDKNGVTVDRCSQCRGIWLDRGELEKLLARATAELDQGPPARQYATRDHRSHDDREPPSSQRRYGQRHHRSFWHDLFD